MVKYKNSCYIATRENSSVPPDKSSFWECFVSSSVTYRGSWSKDTNYYQNDIVKHNNGTYLAIDLVPLGVKISDSMYWLLLGKNIIDNSHVIESYDPSGTFLNKTMNDFPSLFSFDQTMDTNKKYYYACRQTDIKYKPISKKSKWYVPIIFEKILDTNSNFDNRRGHTVFNQNGVYKVTIHINFTGTNLFKTSSYLLKPMDDPEADSYQKDRKIRSGKMSITCASQIKNHLQYCFVVKVSDPLSTLVIMSEHQNVKIKTLSEDNEIIIYGKEKTWILIEKID
jgi:hypothetical protein